MILIGDVLQTFALTIIVLIVISGNDRFGGRVSPKDPARSRQPDVRVYNLLDLFRRPSSSSFGRRTCPGNWLVPIADPRILESDP